MLKLFMRWLCLAVMIGVPMLVWFDYIDRSQANEKNLTIKSIQADLRAILSALARRVEPRQRFEDICLRVVKALRWGEDPSWVLKKLHLESGSGKEALRLFWFDASGRRRSAPWTVSGITKASERLFALLRRAATKPDFEMNNSERRLVTSFMGSVDAIPPLVRYPNCLHDLTERGSPRLAGIFPYRDRWGRIGFVLALVELPAIDHIALVKNALHQINKLVSSRFDLRWGLADLALGTLLSVPNSKPISLIRLRELERMQPITEHISSSTVEASILLQERFLVAVAAVIPVRPKGFLDNRLVRFLLFFVCLLILECFYQWLQKRFIALRIQILTLFGVAAAVSSVTLLGFGQMTRQSREESLIRNRMSEAAEILRKLDQEFKGFLQRQAECYRKILQKAKSVSEVQRRLETSKKWLARARSAITIHSTDFAGKEIFRQEPKGWSIPREIWGCEANKFLNLSAYSMLVYLNDPLEFEKKLAEAKGDIKKFFTISLGRDLAQITGKIGVLKAGLHRIRVFTDIAKNKDNRVIATLVISHENNSLERTYLRQARRLIKKLPGWEKLHFTAILRPGSLRVYSAFRKSEKDQSVRDLLDLTAHTGSIESTIGNYHGQESIIVACPGRELQDYLLVLATPIEPLRAQTRRLEKIFYVTAALMLCFALGLGLIFSELLLIPVNVLSSSIQNLQAGKFKGFDHPKTGDVLEDIGNGISQIAEELQNLATARAIHDDLLPSSPILAGPFSVCGHTWGVSDFGDEMFDYEIDQSGKVIFWLAAIPGTLLGSALGLAMMKMAIRLTLESYSRELSEVKESLIDLPTKLILGLKAEFLNKHSSLAEAAILFGWLDPKLAKLHFACEGLFAWQIFESIDGQNNHDTNWVNTSKMSSLDVICEEESIIKPGSVFKVASPGLICASYDKFDHLQTKTHEKGFLKSKIVDTNPKIQIPIANVFPQVEAYFTLRSRTILEIKYKVS